MFQDENKPNGKMSSGNLKGKEIPAGSLLENIEGQALDAVQEGTSGIESKAAKTINKAANIVGKANSAITTGKNVIDQIPTGVKPPGNTANILMNQTLVPNAKTSVDGSLWSSQQPTSKIYNADNIPEQQLLGINRVVKVELVIEGQQVKHFKHFRLVQSAKKHHEFSLELAHDVMGEAENHLLEKAQDFLGKRLTAVFKYKDVEGSPERTFVGVITEVGFAQDQGSLGNIILTGFSPTVLLDAAPHTQSFGGTEPISLNSIADSVIKEGLDKSKYDYRIAAKYGNITYSSQYEETHYNYLARMAEIYGEQFFYDGEVLHFGELPPPEKAVTLTYGSSVQNIKVNMKVQHVNPSFYGYNSRKDEKLTTGNSEIKHVSDIAQRSYGISKKTFKTPSLSVAPIKSSTSMDVTASQKGTAGSRAVDVFVTSGATSVPFLYPGCAADIEMRKQDSNKTSYFTKLMITDVTHEVDGRGYYNGYFEAIAADTGFLPKPEFEIPKAQPQIAKVTSNTDPENQGRIQVQFDWQKPADKTEFIRMMSPDAGGSDKVSKNRGFMAIPEVGDQVMISFQHNHPDRPFAMGGMFHGKVGGGGGSGNNVKSLSSKSGHTVELNDAGGITVRDKDQNSVFLDGSGNISVDSKVSITMTCNKACSITLDSKGNITLAGKNIYAVGSDLLSMGSGSGEGEAFSGSGFSLDPENVNIAAKTKCSVSGISSVEVGSPGTLKMQANGDTSVSGKKVNIN